MQLQLKKAVKVDYPAGDNELSILQLVRGENTGTDTSEPLPPVSQEVVFAARREVDKVHIAGAVEQYVVDLVMGTREPGGFDGELADWISEVRGSRVRVVHEAHRPVPLRYHIYCDGRLVKLEGNPMHPTNQQTLCPKGQAAPELLYNPDRLQYPMRRAGPPGRDRRLVSPLAEASP